MNTITEIPIKDARNNLAELIERVSLTNVSFLITKFGKPKALIIPAKETIGRKNAKLTVLKKTAGMWTTRKDLRRLSGTRYANIFS